MFGSYPYPPTMILSYRTEDILVFRKKGKADLKNKTDESKITKDDWVNIGTNLWRFNSVRVTYDGKLDGDIKHSAPYPIELPINCIKLWSFVGDLVLDPFAGTGTTAIASIKLKRNFLGFEKDDLYFKMCEKIVKSHKEQKSLSGFGDLKQMNKCDICNTEYDEEECPFCKSNERFEGMSVGDKQQ